MQQPTAVDRAEIEITAGRAILHGDLEIPPRPAGLVLFAHGSGSSRASPRNRQVATRLHEAGFATLLFDLLTADEEAVDDETGEMRFDIGLLSERMVIAIDWLAAQETTGLLWLALFGAGTGAAAALNAAAARPQRVAALVSRGGRPDLAADALPQVRCPVLLIVGGDDSPGIESNRQAAERLAAAHALEIIAGAGHLFEEPGKLDKVAHAAVDWLQRHRPS